MLALLLAVVSERSDAQRFRAEDATSSEIHAAMAAGLWQDTYGATDHHEYWAEGVQAYFDCMRPQFGANTREKLKAYDAEGEFAGFRGAHLHRVGICDPNAVDPATNARSPFFSASIRFFASDTPRFASSRRPAATSTAAPEVSSAVRVASVTSPPYVLSGLPRRPRSVALRTCGPTTCSPTGSPASVKPAHTVPAGERVRLNGYVYETQLVDGTPFTMP